MSEKNLVICDREITYANALAENIAEREELNVSLYICKSSESIFVFSGEDSSHFDCG